MKVYIVKTEHGTILGVYANEKDAEECAHRVCEEAEEHTVISSQQPAFVPDGWTVAQAKSAIRVCNHQGVQFRWREWVNYGEYVGKMFRQGEPDGIFIGIEKDGYAHS